MHYKYLARCVATLKVILLLPCICCSQTVDVNEELIQGEAAYNFGLKIQEIVAREDLEALMALTSGNLRGLRESYLRGKSFSDIFSSAWKEEVLREEPEREPLGWRGYMLAHGAVWYEGFVSNGKPEGWEIIAINGAKEEPKVSGGWIVDGQLLPPRLFLEPEPYFSTGKYFIYDVFLDNILSKET